MNDAPRSEAALEDALSTPDEATVRALAALDGDVIVLGAGGKMGPTLARMARRALDASEEDRTIRRRVLAVSRFSDASVPEQLRAAGIDIIRADLADAKQVRALPQVPNVIWMAGQKFGTTGDPVLAWTHNVVASVYAAEHFGGSRITCFSTGNVYGRSAVIRGGSRESDALVPDGEYAASCVGREHVFESIARSTASPLLLFRLFYACALRYGVLTDLALRIRDGVPISRETAWANVIWQGDANRLALRSLGAASIPAVALNVTGPVASVEQLAMELGKRMGRAPVFEGFAGSDALIANVDVLSRVLPYDPLPIDTLLDWTVEWVMGGQRVLGKPTKFEVRDGRF